MLLKKGKITKNQNKKELKEFCKGLNVLNISDTNIKI